MKKVVFIFIISIPTGTACMAQAADTGSRYDYVRTAPIHQYNCAGSFISLGLGFGGSYPYSGKYYTETPNATLMLDNTFIRDIGPGNISLGALASYKNIASNYTDASNTYTYSQHWQYYLLGTRIAYHLNPNACRSFEIYAGVMAAYYITSYRVTSTDPNYTTPGDPGYYLTPNNYPSFMALSVFAGVRSNISKHFCAWTELGFGYTSIAFGVSYKI